MMMIIIIIKTRHLVLNLCVNETVTGLSLLKNFLLDILEKA
jgi:hypothetical protein